MTKSVFSARYAHLLDAIICARTRAGLTQAEVARKLCRPQSFISKIERGERRLDMIEFLELMEALGADPLAVMQAIRA
jgi:transcriptional regulator with XRE-family HTH domain